MTPNPGGGIGQVIVIGPDEDVRRVLAPSVRALLRLCAGRLRAPGLVPEANEGVVLYALEA
jgi:cell wall assembly regulator SMI1